eukprot:374638_1
MIALDSTKESRNYYFNCCSIIVQTFALVIVIIFVIIGVISLANGTQVELVFRGPHAHAQAIDHSDQMIQFGNLFSAHNSPGKPIPGPDSRPQPVEDCGMCGHSVTCHGITVFCNVARERVDGLALNSDANKFELIGKLEKNDVWYDFVLDLGTVLGKDGNGKFVELECGEEFDWDATNIRNKAIESTGPNEGKIIADLKKNNGWRNNQKIQIRKYIEISGTTMRNEKC